MKKNLLTLLVLVLTLVFTACGTGSNENADQQTSNDNTSNNTEQVDQSEDEDLSGTVTVSGSTSVEKVLLGLAEEFMALYPDVEVTYESIGSSAGIKNANEGVTMLGTASRNLKEKEEAWGLTSAPIAYDGIAVIVHPDNELKDLTLEQVQKIYKGEITNWSQVGGADEDIVVVSREDGSGTRGAFEEIVGFEGELTEQAILAEGNGNVQVSVANNPYAIGYVSFTYIDETVQPVNIDGTAPTIENVLSESYSISRPFLVVYHEANQTPESKAFYDFIFTEDGQKIVEQKGGIPVAK